MKYRISIYLALFLAIYFLAGIHPGFSQSSTSREERGEKIVKEVQVGGNRRISSVIILSKVKTQIGVPLSQDIISEDIKRIYELGFFSNISVDIVPYKEGVKVLFIVEEKPYVEKIEIGGNRAFEDIEIQRVMVLSSGDIYLKKVLDEDIKRIIALYEKKGYYQVKIEPGVKIEELEKKVFIHLEIAEGGRSKVKKIIILGNKNVSVKKILRVMKTRKSGLFRRGIFGEETFQEDQERVISFYKSLGYIDAEIKDAKIEYDSTGTLLYITIEVEEGEQYAVEKIDFAGNELFNKEELYREISMKEGDAYSPSDLNKDIGKLHSFYAHQGYITSQIWEETSLDKETKKAKIVYHIQEEVKIYVNLVKIKGNTKTKDNVIRREITIKPGEEFDGDKVERSKQRIKNLGYFKKVEFEIEPCRKPNYRNLVFEVEEEKTGLLQFGFGYSSMENLIGFIQISQENFDIGNPPVFIGGGQKLRLKARMGDIRQDYSLSFTEPHVKDGPVLAGFDLYDSRSNWDVFDQHTKGGDIRVGRALTEYISLMTMYKYDQVEISNLPLGASPIIAEEEGSFDESSFTATLIRDSRDNIFDPGKGSLSSISSQYAGGIIGGDRNFTKYMGDTNWHFPIIKEKEHTISLRFRAGVAAEFAPSERVPLNERFFLGGANTIRGYKYRDVGPEDENDNDIGGKSFFITNVEYKFPLYEKILKGVLFYDTGNAWQETSDINLNDLVSGVGLGARIMVPALGPVKIDYGYGIQRKGTRLHFSMGYTF